MAISIQATKAAKILKDMGVPIYHEGKGWDGTAQFSISAEENSEEIWGDYYNPSFGEFGVNSKIVKVLRDHGLYCEWCNAGVLDVHFI